MTNLERKPVIYNSDLKNNNSLLLMTNLAETYIQQACHREFNTFATELQLKYKKKLAEFVQLDNGGSSKASTRKRKAAEGTKAGVPDTALFLGSPCGKYSKVILVEFKRIGTPSQIKISPLQKYYYDWFGSIGFSTYITNNPLYFKEVILKEARDFFKSH